MASCRTTARSSSSAACDADAGVSGCSSSCAGVGSLATEICASRLLAPYYGSSTIVWANVIGLVLASLSLGYWLGGRVADRRPDAAACSARSCSPRRSLRRGDPVRRAAVPGRLVDGLDEVSTGAAIGSFFAVLVLFVPPVTLLGAVAPSRPAGRHGHRDGGRRGGRGCTRSRPSGACSARSAPALVAIPAIGTQRTLLATAALIGAGGALMLRPRWALVPAGVTVLLLVPPGAVKARAGVLYEHESRYGFVQVVQRGGAAALPRRGARHALGLAAGHGADRQRVGHVPRRARRCSAVRRSGSRSSAMRAGRRRARSGASIPAARSTASSSTRTSLPPARRCLGLGDNPRLRVHSADARPFLRRTKERYDLIFVDAYRPPYVPFYLADARVLPARARAAAAGRALAVNVATVPSDHRLAEGIAGTMAHEFPQVEAWQALRFNQLVVGLTRRSAGGARQARASRLRLAFACSPAAGRPHAAGGPERRPVDGRPLAGRVGDRPHDRRVGRARRAAGGTAGAAHRARPVPVRSERAEAGSCSFPARGRAR